MECGNLRKTLTNFLRFGIIFQSNRKKQKCRARPQLGERVGCVGVEKAVVVYIEGQRQPGSEEGAGKDVVVTGPHFARRAGRR